MANYELYEPDNTTPIAIPQPKRSTWEVPQLGTFANGAPRVGRYARVVWSYPLMTSAQREVFTANRPDDGIMQFKTFRPGVGGSPSDWVKCAGVMELINTGAERDGEWFGISVVWARVEVV